MLGVIVGVLVALPPAGATDAHRASATIRARPVLPVVVVGDFFSFGYASSADPALRLSVPPTLEALNQVQLANQDVQIHVLFIPVWEATWDKLYKSSGPGKPPLINAVKDAKVVIAGVGADVPSFADSLRAILFGTHVPATAYPPLTGIMENGSYQQEETAFLEDLAAREPAGGAIVTLGYPLIQQVRAPSGPMWWSALSWSTIAAQQARLANRFVSVLDARNAAATKAAGTQYQDIHALYADPAAMPAEAAARGSQATALKETLVANTLLPYVTQAVDDALTSMGVHGSQDIPPITSASRWDLSVQLPTGIQVPLPHSGSGPGSATRVAPARQRLTNVQASQGDKRRKPVMITVPVIPAFPAPLPKPIAPAVVPKAVGSGGAGSGGAGTSPGGASPGGGTTPSGSGATPPGGGTTSPGGGTPSPGGTTSPGGGTSPSAGGTTSPSAGGTTSPSAGGTSPSFGGSASSGGASASSGGSAS
jgi:hypothetical protein